MSVNKVILCGNIGREPETRYFPNGGGVCNFSIATSEKWTDKASGQLKELTEWHNISAFGKLADVCQQYLHKGSKPTVIGKIRSRKYNDKEGVERTAFEIIAESVELPSKSEGGSGASRGSSSRGEAYEPPPADDEDIPF